MVAAKFARSPGNSELARAHCPFFFAPHQKVLFASPAPAGLPVPRRGEEGGRGRAIHYHRSGRTDDADALLFIR